MTYKENFRGIKIHITELNTIEVLHCKNFITLLVDFPYRNLGIVIAIYILGYLGFLM